MDKSKITILEEKIFLLYENNKVKKWSFNFEQAKFCVMHASYFVMPADSHDWRTPFLQKMKNKRTSFFKKTINLDKLLSNLEPHEAITSSFLFCIERKIHNESELKNFICNSMYYFGPIFLIEDGILTNNILSIIMKLKLADLYQLQVVFGFVKYLTVEKKVNHLHEIEDGLYTKKTSNISDKVNNFLHLFSYFSSSFIKQCQIDCMMLKNFSPLKLALYVLYVNSLSKGNYTILVYDKNYTLLDFNQNLARKELYTFKKQLLNSRQINKEFLSKARFFPHYYSDFETILMFQSFTQHFPFFFELKSFFYGLENFLTAILNPENISNPQNWLKTLKICGSLVGPGLSLMGPDSTSFVPHPTAVIASGRYITPRIVTRAIPRSMISRFKDSPFRGSWLNTRDFYYSQRQSFIAWSQLPTTVNFQQTSGVNIVWVDRIYVYKGNKQYYYDLVTVDGKQYASKLGIWCRYKDRKSVIDFIEKEMEKISGKQPDIMEKIAEVGGDKHKSMSLDHTATQSIREIFKLSKERAHTFASPGVIINGLRTNTTMGLEFYTEYDLRPDPDEVVIGQGSPFNGNFTFRRLYEEGLELNFSMWRPRVQKTFPKLYPYVEFFSPAMHIGAKQCWNNDLEEINEFLQVFDSNVDSTKSVQIFQCLSLHESKLADIKDIKNKLDQYDVTNNRIIVKPYLIEIFLNSATKKHKLGCSFQLYLSNQKFWEYTEADRIRLVQQTTTLIENYLIDLKNHKGVNSDYLRIQKSLDKFKHSVEQHKNLSDVYSPEECHFIVSNEIKLGYLYPNSSEYNGKICDYSVENAIQVAKNKNEPENLYVQKNKNFLQPVDSISTLDSIYTKFPKSNVLGILNEMKSHLPERVLNKMVRSMHFHEEDFYFDGIALPNPNKEVHQWLMDNLDPKTIEFLQEKTTIHIQGGAQSSVTVKGPTKSPAELAANVKRVPGPTVKAVQHSTSVHQRTTRHNAENARYRVQRAQANVAALRNVLAQLIAQQAGQALIQRATQQLYNDLQTLQIAQYNNRVATQLASLPPAPTRPIHLPLPQVAYPAVPLVPQAAQPVAQPQAAQPVAQPQAVQPVAQPQAAQPQAAQPVAQPQAVQPVAQPQAAQPQAAQPVAQPVAQPQAAQSAAQPQAVQPSAPPLPQAGQPAAAQPQAGQPAAQPQAGQPAAQPQAGQPAGAQPPQAAQ